MSWQAVAQRQRHGGADTELGIAYLPVEISPNDYYGGHRPGDTSSAHAVRGNAGAAPRDGPQRPFCSAAAHGWSLPASTGMSRSRSWTVPGMPRSGLAPSRARSAAVSGQLWNWNDCFDPSAMR